MDENKWAVISVKTSLDEGYGMGCRHVPKQTPKGNVIFFFFSRRKKKHFLRHPLDTLPCVILSFCLGCEQSWPCYSKLLLSSAIGRAARVGIVTRQLCKAETETLHQIRASALCEAHHPGAYEAGKSLLEVLVCAVAQMVGKFLLCQGATAAQVSMDMSCLSQEVIVPLSALSSVQQIQSNLSYSVHLFHISF